MTSFLSVRQEIIKTGTKLYRRGMVSGTDGNISVRLDNNHIMITPSGFPKGELDIEDMAVIDLDGNVLEGKPSSELAMHCFIYKQRSDINACVHSHAPYSTAFTVAGLDLPDNVLPEVVLFVGKIPLTDYAPPGTKAVPDSIAPYIKENHAFLLRNHGLLTIGRKLKEAYNRHETVENYARIVTLARQLGEIKLIPKEDYNRLESMRKELEKKSNTAFEG